MTPRFEVYPRAGRRPTTMEHTDRLRAVIAIQQEVVAAGLDPDVVARLVAERAQALVGGTAAKVALRAEGAPIDRRPVVADGTVTVPLVHDDRVCGMLRIDGVDL